MAKPNVHTASRDELVEAGVRAELADEILKRRRKGAIRLEALEEVPGVGPATLEQLRQVLDFREQQAASAMVAGRASNGHRRTNAPAPGRAAAATSVVPGGGAARTNGRGGGRRDQLGRATGGQGGPGHDGSRGRGYRRSGGSASRWYAAPGAMGEATPGRTSARTRAGVL